MPAVATVNTVFPVLAVMSGDRTWALGRGIGLPPSATRTLLPWVLAAKPAVAVRLGPVAPVGPDAPVGPVAPAAPAAPVMPATPTAPFAPAEPVAPVAPVAPTAPVGPVAPVAPVEPCIYAQH